MDKKNFKEEILEAIGSFGHGMAKSKNNIPNHPEYIVKQGEVGLITAYLPDEKTFAIYFGDNRWFTFKNDEKMFLDNFEIFFE